MDALIQGMAQVNVAQNWDVLSHNQFKEIVDRSPAIGHTFYYANRMNELQYAKNSESYVLHHISKGTLMVTIFPEDPFNHKKAEVFDLSLSEMPHNVIQGINRVAEFYIEKGYHDWGVYD